MLHSVHYSAPQYPTPEEKAEMDARSVYVGNVSQDYSVEYEVDTCCVCRWTISRLPRSWVSTFRPVDPSTESPSSVTSILAPLKGM